MKNNELNKRLSSVVKDLTKKELSRKETLPENLHGVEVDVFEEEGEKICHIYFIINGSISGFDSYIMRPIQVVIKRNVKSLFGDIFEGGIYSSLEEYDEFYEEKPLLEYERKQQDKKYEEQYEKMKKNFINFFNTIIDAYYESDSVIHLYDKNENRIMSYYKDSRELYYSRTLNDLITELMPHYLWMRHGQYVIADVFNSHFDDPVKYVTPAGMIN